MLRHRKDTISLMIVFFLSVSSAWANFGCPCFLPGLALVGCFLRSLLLLDAASNSNVIEFLISFIVK